MSAVAIKNGEVREVTRSRQSTRFVTGLRWCPWCDHSSQLDRVVCRGCGATFDEDYTELTEETLDRMATLAAQAIVTAGVPVEPDSAAMCTCKHGQNHHNDESGCRYRQYCGCEGFNPVLAAE